jgi:hypothetical protein
MPTVRGRERPGGGRAEGGDAARLWFERADGEWRCRDRGRVSRAQEAREEIGGYRVEPAVDGEGRLRPDEALPGVAAARWERHRALLDDGGLLPIVRRLRRRVRGKAAWQRPLS